MHPIALMFILAGIVFAVFFALTLVKAGKRHDEACQADKLAKLYERGTVDPSYRPFDSIDDVVAVFAVICFVVGMLATMVVRAQ